MRLFATHCLPLALHESEFCCQPIFAGLFLILCMCVYLCRTERLAGRGWTEGTLCRASWSRRLAFFLLSPTQTWFIETEKNTITQCRRVYSKKANTRSRLWVAQRSLETGRKQYLLTKITFRKQLSCSQVWILIQSYSKKRLIWLVLSHVSRMRPGQSGGRGGTYGQGAQKKKI